MRASECYQNHDQPDALLAAGDATGSRAAAWPAWRSCTPATLPGRGGGGCTSARSCARRASWSGCTRCGSWQETSRQVGFEQAIAHARWIWDTERTLRLPSEARRPAAAAPAPAAVRDREPLLRDDALRDADRDADLAVRPAPRRLPGGAQRDGREHGDLPAHLLHPGRAAAAAARRRRRGPGGPVRRVRLRRGRLDRGRRPAVRHAVGPRRLVDPGRLGRHHQGPQPLALADPAAPG